MSSKPPQTLADYVVVAVSPALVMLLVGSLVFFLTNIFYEGEFHGRLRFSCAMFVMAAVLIARISIDEGREYAGMFALPLAIVTMLSILRYTDAGVLLALPLIVAIWWSTDKLTWDCTVVDDHKDASGEGLLQTIGLDGDGAEDEAERAEGQASMDLEASTSSRKAEVTSWWRKWVAKRRRHHTPGVWVVYFSLASLPLFGVGQWLLPDSSAARNSSFRLLCLYVASALALLMTTSFLQLRRYLRQRRLQMPGDMARVWLGTGSIMIVGLVVACLLLPLPNTESALSEYVSRLASRDDLRSSQFALGDEGIKDAKPGRPSTGERVDSSRDAGDGEGQSPPTADGKDGERRSEQSGERRQADSSDRSSESSADGQERHDQQTDARPSSDKSNSQQNDGQPSKSTPSESPGGRTTSPDSERDAGRDSNPTDDRSEKSSEAGQNPRSASPPRPSSTPWNPLQSLSLGSLTKWIYWLIVGAVVGFLLWRYWHAVAVAIRCFLRDLSSLWARILGRSEAGPSTVEDAAEAPPLPCPFSAYRNPFAAGSAVGHSPRQLVKYSFEALQAWAQERNCGKLPEQTPLEFALRIGARDKRIGPLARNLATLYNQAAYANDPLPTTTIDQLRQLWAALQAA